METLLLSGLFLVITSLTFFGLKKLDWLRRRRQVLARLRPVMEKADGGGSRESFHTL